MSEIKIMVVPGKICRVELSAGMTVLMACEQAERQMPGVGWLELAKDREVRVQNRKFSNTTEIPDGYFGTISGTALNDGEVVLILTKIKGNDPGLGVLTCVVNGVEFALETPVEARVVLAQVAGYGLDKIGRILINGDEADLSQLVGDGDTIVTNFFSFSINSQAYSGEGDAGSVEDVLRMCGTDIGKVERVLINGVWRKLSTPVKDGDKVEVIFKAAEVAEKKVPATDEITGEASKPEMEAADPADESDDETVTVTINGFIVTGRLQDIRRILSC
jgi:ribosomal 50S subunit-recycling heat shock protein